MAKYVVDTNVFIDVLRSAAERQAYERFLQLASPVDPLVPVIEGVLEASPR